MANHSAKVAKMARILAILQINVGFLLFCFGIADRVVAYYNLTGQLGFGIWIGVWMCITGGLGIPGTRRERNTFSRVCALVFMGFSIFSVVLAGIMIGFYGMTIAWYRYYIEEDYNTYGTGNREYDAPAALSAIILILGIVEFIIGIWAAVCVCYYYEPPQGEKVIYSRHSSYIMTQGSDGAPTSFQTQAGGGMVAVQTAKPMAREGQAQTVLVPDSEELTLSNQPSGTMATGYQQQQGEMIPSCGLDQ